MKKAKDISILEIVEIVDDLDIFNEFLIGLKSCKGKEGNIQCPLNQKYAPIGNQLYELFKNETIESLKNDIKSSKSKIGYKINFFEFNFS